MRSGAREVMSGFSPYGDETVLVVKPGASSVVEIAAGVLASGSRTVTVDWGDGTKDAIAGSLDRTEHVYASPGVYVIRISNDLSSFGFTRQGGSLSSRDVLLEVPKIGSKVVKLEDYAFNGCRNLGGTLAFPSVVTVGNYAFGSVGRVREISLPALQVLREDSFYASVSAQRLRVDSAKDFDDRFFEAYGTRIEDVFVRGLTRRELYGIAEFPFKAASAVRFHCADGIILADGTNV